MDESQTEPPPPQMQIAHILLWTFACSLLLAGARISYGVITATLASHMRIDTGMHSLGLSLGTAALAGSVGMVAILLGIQRRCRGESALIAPGHWIAVMMLLDAIFVIVAFPILFVFESQLISFVLLLSPVMAIVIDLLAAKRCSAEPMWKYFFWAHACKSLVKCLSSLNVWYLFSPLATVAVWAVAILVGLAVQRDLQARRLWDWLHWASVFLLGLQLTSTMVTNLVLLLTE